MMECRISAAGFPLVCAIERLGDDCVLVLGGGDAPHIGSSALAIPRPSLTGTGQSATVSTLNKTGHKDDFLANPLAHAVASELGCTVACIAGVHIDDATPEQIEAIRDAIPELAQRICTHLKEDSNA